MAKSNTALTALLAGGAIATAWVIARGGSRPKKQAQRQFNAFDEIKQLEDMVATEFDPSFDPEAVVYSGTNVFSRDAWENGPFPVYVYAVSEMNYTNPFDGEPQPYVLIWSNKVSPSESSNGIMALANLDRVSKRLQYVKSGSRPPHNLA